MEFLEKSHIYINDYGIAIPSVTQLLEWKFGFSYDNIPKNILEAKAVYGTRIHALIEDINNGIKPKTNNSYEAASVQAYKLMAKKLPKVKASELKVHYQNRLAGTIDIVYVDGTLGDNKTYATIDEEKKERTRWQLSFYELCYCDMYHLERTGKGRMLHMPKSMKYSCVEFDQLHSFEECISILEEYEACHQ